jgi:hypothetical protein
LYTTKSSATENTKKCQQYGAANIFQPPAYARIPHQSTVPTVSFLFPSARMPHQSPTIKMPQPSPTARMSHTFPNARMAPPQSATMSPSQSGRMAHPPPTTRMSHSPPTPTILHQSPTATITPSLCATIAHPPPSVRIYHPSEVARMLSREKRLSTQINSLRVQLYRMKVKLQQYENNCKCAISTTQKRKINTVKNKQKESQTLTSLQQNIIESQVNATSTSKKGMRWNDKIKLVALGLFYRSPSAYRFLENIFSLPGIRSLQRFISVFQVQPGFRNDYVESLQKRCATMTPQDKCVSIIFDGMSIKQQLEYMSSKDIIVGFENMGDDFSMSKKPANQVVQFLVRGIATPWKQPLGHFFVNNTMKSDVLKYLLMEAISISTNIGLTVMCVVCDQETSHLTTFRSLNVTREEPWITMPSAQRIYIIYDVPHLFKNIRNNLINHDFVINGKVVSWKYFQKLYSLETSNTLRYAPKLTAAHIYLPVFAKMKVKLATQLLSHTVASAMKAYIQLEKMPEEARETAEFAEMTNDMFDILNSRQRFTSPMTRNALTLDNLTQFETLDKYLTWIGSWKFQNPQTNAIKESIPFKEGLLCSIRSIKLMTLDLLQIHQYRYVLTSRLNHDVLENWFSLIRGKGGCRDNPTTSQYESASKNVTVNWLLDKPESGRNCETDIDEFIGILGTIVHERNERSKEIRKEEQSEDTKQPSDNSSCKIDVISSISCFTPSLTEANIACYIAGYIAMKNNKFLHSCKRCYADIFLDTSIDENLTDEYMFIQIKTYDWAKNGLTAPSHQLLQVCTEMENVLQTFLPTVSHQENLSVHLFNKICQLTPVIHFLNAACHKDVRHKIIALYIKLRIFHFVRMTNQTNQSQALQRKQRRKLEKFHHN